MCVYVCFFVCVFLPPLDETSALVRRQAEGKMEGGRELGGGRVALNGPADGMQHEWDMCVIGKSVW